jgi:acyl-CoA thioesterase I
MHARSTVLFTVLAASLWLSACASRRIPNVDPSKFKEPIRVACVGDSITYGAGIEDRDQKSYPAILNRMLGSDFTVRNCGVSGATLLKKGDKPYWAEAEFTAAGEFRPHIILIKLGTNDTKPQNAEHLKEFEGDLIAMIEHFSRLSSHPKIWLCLPVPVYETRWGINEQTLTDSVIPAILKAADKKNLPVIDLHTALSDRPELFPDKIHPNAAGASLMAKIIHDAMLIKQSSRPAR